MPTAPLHYCKIQGCGERIPRGETYCKEHKKREREAYDRTRGSAASRGYDRKWQEVRDLYIKENPLCEDCRDKGITKMANIVHHIVELTRGGAKYAFGNLKSLCTACHNNIHGWGKK